jgi:hypothetical protein
VHDRRTLRCLALVIIERRSPVIDCTTRSISSAIAGGVTAFPYCLICWPFVPSTVYVPGNAIAAPISRTASSGSSSRRRRSSRLDERVRSFVVIDGTDASIGRHVPVP